ncbi:hypothetical protein MPSEU_000243700 [Mayamaea pseudoterrestris]|nr:hypothetical protein MPSEU_000243700 [Mayamaea pseudoterrestris]
MRDFAVRLLFLACHLLPSLAFVGVAAKHATLLASTTVNQRAPSSSSWRLFADLQNVKTFLSERYPLFDSLILSKNQDVWKKLSDVSDGGCTIFAPSNQAMESLGDKKLEQLRDVRNDETAQKMGAFHVVGERVTADELFNSGGVVTVGGVVEVGRSVKGGFFGIGGTEDGGVTLSGAKVTTTVDIDKCLIHEVDALISPAILWRYCDQLRIPGSK